MYVAVPPCATVRAVGVAETVKSGGGAGLTVKLIVVLLVTPPLRPPTVMVKVPIGVKVLVTMLRVELVAPLAGGVNAGGLNLVPGRTWLLGKFTAKSPTELLNPFALCTVIV